MTWIVPEHWRVESPNKNTGRAGTPVDLLLMHCTAGLGNARKVALLFADQLAGDVDNSAHFAVGRGGSIAQCVSLDDTAWHGGDGGKSRFPLPSALAVARVVPIGATKPMPRVINRRSIGVEVCNRAFGGGVARKNQIEARHSNPGSKEPLWERYYDPQIAALLRLLPALVKSVPTLRWVCSHEFVTHKDTLGKPGAKLDPGPAFPWDHFPFWLYGLERVVYDFKQHAWVVLDGLAPPLSRELVQAGLSTHPGTVDPGPVLSENL